MRQLLPGLIFAVCMVIAPLHASDKAKEQRWADQIVDMLLVGEAVWLDVGNEKVLSLVTEQTTEQAKGGAIVVHGIGAHPNWPEVIHPLRSRLPEQGWTTLSIQMPILENQAEAVDYEPLFAEVAPRFEAAIAYLHDQGIDNIVIIAHSMGAAMSSHYLASHPTHPVRAFVGIGMNQSRIDIMDNASNLEKIKIPVLDLYGSKDLEGVMASVTKRASSANKAGNNDYLQVKIEGADHFFNGKTDILVKRVESWLDQHAVDR
ncbi:MAG: alpha/beta fold hydrolase [Thiohalophilus sp.]|jgi:dienelactone hydrolase